MSKLRGDTREFDKVVRPKQDLPSASAQLYSDVLGVKWQTHGKMLDAVINEYGYRRVDQYIRELLRLNHAGELKEEEFWPRFQKEFST